MSTEHNRGILLSRSDLVVRFAGEGGQGLLSTATGLATAFTQVGYHSQTFATFPSQIVGGPTWMQARISTKEILSRGDTIDVLVAFNEHAYNNHRDEVSDSGIIIYDSEQFEPADKSKSLGMEFGKLAKSTGNTRAANMVVMGALANVAGVPLDLLENFIKKRWASPRYGPEIVESNIQALMLGYKEGDKNGLTLGELDKPIPPKHDQILINGNDAIAIGAFYSGLKFYVGYPISPATTILTWMQSNLIGDDRFVYQSSSEIESIASIIGASYAGKKSMTATAGPGFSLMAEGIGLAWMAEIPIVVTNVQRGGPSTGLPTKTEQSDLLSAINPSHGDVSLPVIAPGTVEECFSATVAAFNWAEKYQGPVVLLTEHSLAERQQNIKRPDIDQIEIHDRSKYTGGNGYLRYENETLSPMPIPGSAGSYVANGSEHDPMGDTTHLPERHIQMTNRRFSKLSLLENETYEKTNEKSSICLMPWGGSKGPTLEVYNSLIQEGIDLAWYYTMYINPLPKKMIQELKNKKLVLVPELNYQGQFSSFLRSHQINAHSITQYTGLPFKVTDLRKQITEILKDKGI